METLVRDIVIYGAGGFAREVAWLVESIASGGGQYRPAAFVDDDESHHGVEINGLPVLSLAEATQRYPDGGLAVAVGSPSARRKLTEKGISAGLEPVPLVAPDVRMSRWVEVGSGSVVCAGNILTTNITIGEGVQINLDCTVGHDVVFGDYTTLAPGVHVSGWVHFGQDVYVGTGAVIINGTSDDPLTIGDGAVIGAGACVTGGIDAGVTAVGVPARPR